MTFVTRLTLRSGDRVALEKTMEEIKHTVEKKGIQLKGPHTPPPVSYRAPQYRRMDDTKLKFSPWEYTVYERWVDMVGYDDSIKRITGMEFPKCIHVEVEVTQMSKK